MLALLLGSVFLGWCKTTAEAQAGSDASDPSCAAPVADAPGLAAHRSVLLKLAVPPVLVMANGND